MIKNQNQGFWHHLSRPKYLEVAPATAVRENLNSQVNHDYKQIIQV